MGGRLGCAPKSMCLTPRGTGIASNVARQRAERSLTRRPVEATSHEAPSVRFFFLSAARVRESTEKTLLPLQALLDEGGEWIVEKEMNFDDACRGKYLLKFTVVSHRWLTQDQPDPDGVQLEEIRKYLHAHPEVDFVWLDWPCMWQGHKNRRGKSGARDLTEAEVKDFGVMLSEVNLLYIGCKVLVLLDLSSRSRFWTSYEAWLAHQQPSASGLRVATQQAARCEVVAIMGARNGDKTTLADIIAEDMDSPDKAATYLRNADIAVTNLSDKEGQLARLAGLEGRVKGLFARDAAMALVNTTVRGRGKGYAHMHALTTKRACARACARAWCESASTAVHAHTPALMLPHLLLWLQMRADQLNPLVLARAVEAAERIGVSAATLLAARSTASAV